MCVNERERERDWRGNIRNLAWYLLHKCINNSSKSHCSAAKAAQAAYVLHSECSKGSAAEKVRVGKERREQEWEIEHSV